MASSICVQSSSDLLAQRKIDFASEVQPIFAKNCVACHGPDDAEGGLRLTEKASVYGELDSGEHAVVPGKPDHSELLNRIASDDESLRMPPEEKPLSAKQIDTIRSWIEQGAEWKAHWGFARPVERQPKEVSQSAWIRNPIDQFILKKLEEAELKPASPADESQLLRRAFYDLTGLPPSPEEVRDYLNDSSPTKYEALIDRLLASKHFGEKWGRHWLDLVRFAETNSYERDGPKPEAWRYRDYVIRSFNTNKPYDQFIIEQLAGDEVESPTYDTISATGIYRLGLWDDEPVDREVAKFDGLDDIVTTTGQVFLGLTINCARCHDHKIDPIPQADYYGLLAFFRNIRPYGRGDSILKTVFENDQAKLEYEKQVAELEAKRNAVQSQVLAIENEFREKLRSHSSTEAAVSDIDDLRFSFFRDTWEKLPVFDEIKAETTGTIPSGRFDISLATRPNSFGFVFEGTLKVPETGEYKFELDSDDGSRLIIDGKKLLEHDGIHGLGGTKRATISLNAGRIPVRLEYFQGQAGKGLHVAWSGPSFEKRKLSASDEQTAAEDLKHSLAKHGKELLGKEAFETYKKKKREFEQLKKRRVNEPKVLAVTEYGADAPETFVLTRGNPHAPAEKVEPHFPTILGAGEPSVAKPRNTMTTGRRMALAKWIASSDNIQTGRVMMNRVWQHLFGRGIVRSASNFGVMGTPPTHPELLDWLAIRFTKDDWNIKSMIRLIMLSNAYRMSSQPNEKAYAMDPLNDLFWRQNMRRLSAEEIRDSVLAVNGTLNRESYGPSVFPEIPKEVLAGQSRPGSGWGRSSKEQQNRRSVYVYVKRSLLLPVLESFDAADTDTTCPVRFVTTQPTQALALLNSKFSNDQAKLLAERIKREVGENVQDQVKRVIWLTTQRQPTEQDINDGIKLIAELQSKDGADQQTALNMFCLMALNLNEFLYLD